MVVSGCSGKDNIYKGIKKQDLTGIGTQDLIGIEMAKNPEYIYE